MSITFTERYEGVEDRTDWPAGPWDDEPDKVVWVDPATGLDCMARRGGGGAWCGYVGVSEAHPWHGKGYSEHLPIPCDEEADPDGYYCYSHSPDALISVHGGITFAAGCREDGNPAKDVCHISEDGPVWWFGFDCSHCFDLRPGGLRWSSPLDGEVYRDLSYVISETTSMAAQMAEVSA